MNHQAELLEQQLIEERAKVAALETEKAGRQQAVQIIMPPSPYMPDTEPGSMTAYEEGEAQGRCDMWAEVKRLNTAAPQPSPVHADDGVNWKAVANEQMEIIQKLKAMPAPAAPDVAGLVEALRQIVRWDGFPPTGQTWPGTDRPISYCAAYGSNGERDFMRNVAAEALAIFHREG